MKKTIVGDLCWFRRHKWGAWELLDFGQWHRKCRRCGARQEYVH